MHFYCIGVSSNSTSLNAREQIYRQRECIEKFWLRESTRVAILATCNRFEIYALARDLDSAQGQYRRFSRAFSGFIQGYFLHGQPSVFCHALTLASGLDSQLKGEAQILQQIAVWMANDSFPSALKDLWRSAYQAARLIRSHAGLDSIKHNIATVVFADQAAYRPAAARYTVAVIGTGKIAELFALHKPREASLIFVSRKHRRCAHELARSCNGVVADFSERNILFGSIDMLVTASASPHFIIRREMLAAAAPRRTPLYMYDVAFPRQIEPEIRSIENVVLKNMDDLSPLFERYNADAQPRLRYAKTLVEAAVRTYQRDFYAEYFKTGDSREHAGLAAS